jgi:hypothetical protein
MTLNALLLALVVGAVVLALSVDLAALFGWLRGRWHMPAPAPPAAGPGAAPGAECGRLMLPLQWMVFTRS